jgi:hypothetical protein
VDLFGEFVRTGILLTDLRTGQMEFGEYISELEQKFQLKVVVVSFEMHNL